MAKGPHILIAGLITSGGLSFLSSAQIANAEKSQQEAFSSQKDQPLIEAPTVSQEKSLIRKNKNSGTPSNEVVPPIELQLKADRQSYDVRQKRFIAEGSVSAWVNGAVLKADRIEFDRNFKTLFASGRVRFKKGFQYFQATSFRYSFIQKLGELKDVYGVLDLENLDQDLNIISKRRQKKPFFEEEPYIKSFKHQKRNSESTKTSITKSDQSQSPVSIEQKKSSMSWAQSLPPLSSWSRPKKPFSSPVPINEETGDIACPPVLPLLPNWNEHSWALTAWGGGMTDSDFGESFLFSGDARDELVFGIGLNKRIYRSGPFAFELEGNIFRHSATEQAGGRYQPGPFAKYSAQSFGEGVLGMGVRLWLRPWLNLGLIEGVSYNTAASNYERTSRNKNSQFLNYLGAEIEAVITKKLSLVGRIHHRSGAFGTFGGVKGGSNAYLFGFRYRWGIDHPKYTPGLSPPIGCAESENERDRYPQAIDDTLEVISLPDIDPFSKVESSNTNVKTNTFISDSGLSKTSSSKLSFSQQDKLREKSIALIDQRVSNIELKKGFSVQGKLGIQSLSEGTEEKNQPASVQISQLSPKVSSKLITGYISRWRVQSAIIRLNPEGWTADRMSFSNDPFTPTQTRIEAQDVAVKKEENGDILITSRRSRLILEERMRIPIVNSTKIKRRETVQNRWVLGIDEGDRDGLFVGRVLEPIKLNDNYKLSLQPQFLIQRAIKNETNSYIANDSSITSDKVTAPITSADLFGMRAKVRGESLGFKTNLDANISTFNSDRIANGSRYWASLKRSISVPLFGEIDTTLFGAYRYRVWNGSIGEAGIYTVYAGFSEKSYAWDWGDLSNTYILRLGLGNYQAEASQGGGLSELWRANLYSSLGSVYTIWRGETADLSSELAYRYSPVPITPGLTLDTYLSTAYFAYEGGTDQRIISFTSGPTLTLGTFSKPFLDYTKFSIYSGGALKQGGSPFSFDEVVDLSTLGMGLTQQIAGPLVLNTGIELNIDGGSEYYGKTINSNIELRWQRRSYDLGIYYKPSSGKGGISFHLNDFNFKGTGVPFIPYNPGRDHRGKTKSPL